MEFSMVNCSVRGTIREVEGEGVNCVDEGWFGSCGWKLRFVPFVAGGIIIASNWRELIIKNKKK